MKNFLEEYNKRKAKIEEYLLKYITLKDVSSPLREAMQHLILAGGKRVRPIITYETYKVCGGEDDKEIIPPACAVEIVHTFTLIHDDLPAIDNDDLRRGVPTVHKVYGEDIAILAGDALFILGIEVFLDSKAKTERVLLALNSLVKALGPRGVIEGEVLDIKGESMELNTHYLKNIHFKKTALLFSSCFEIGAILGNADKEMISKLKDAGIELGMAFQIKDDILDATGEKEKTGKKIKKDINKMTYVKAYGVEKSLEIAKEHVNKAKLILEEFNDKTKFLRELCDFIIKREF
ncbi:MAG: polyprenyl synthetase family protein [Candidatus Hydrothermales bacterium]